MICLPFSILERIVVVETQSLTLEIGMMGTFSILERIVVVETLAGIIFPPHRAVLSVSSNGSWWLKHRSARRHPLHSAPFSILERIVVVETPPVFPTHGENWPAF